MRLPAVAVSVPVPVPSGGVYVTWRPAVFDSVPPVTFQVTCAVLLTSTAVNTVGWVTGDESSDGVMVNDGPPFADPPHPWSDTPRQQAVPTINQRINISRLNKIP
jgi:hypothetical protein